METTPDTKGMIKVFEKPAALSPGPNSFCFGCTYGIIGRVFCEAIEELGLVKDVITVVGNGCYSSFRFELDGTGAPHGRAPAVATAIKRLLPHKVVITLQGDGDMASEGVAEIVHAAWRGEKISVIWFNNSTIAMTGGQMSPTSVLGERTTTTPGGRDAATYGHPMKMTEMLAMSPGVAYAARVSVHRPSNIQRTKEAIKKCLEVQQTGAGMTVLEIMSTCNSNWRMSPMAALEWMEKNMLPVYPVGEIKSFKMPAAPMPVPASA